MVKETPNHVPINMIGLAQTSRKIIEDGDVPIFLVVLSNPESLHSSLNHYCDCTGMLLSTLCMEVIQNVYDRTFSFSVRRVSLQEIQYKCPYRLRYIWSGLRAHDTSPA